MADVAAPTVVSRRREAVPRGLNGLRAIGTGAAWLLFAYLCWQIVTVDRGPNALPPMEDFHAYYDAARNLDAGTPIYRSDATTAVLHAYLYPPLLAQVMIPLARLDFSTASRVWLAGNLALFFATLAVLTSYIPRWTLRDVFRASMLLFAPAYFALDAGQASIVMLALMTGVYVLHRREMPYAAGVLLAVACWVKVYPAFFLFYFAFRRDWKVLVGTIAAGALLGLAQLVTAPTDMTAYLTDVLPNLNAQGQPTLNLGGASTLTFALLVAPPQYVSIVRWGTALVLVVLTLVAARHSAGERGFTLSFAMMAVVAPMLGSTFLLASWVAVLLPMALLLSVNRGKWSALAVLFAFIVLSSVPILNLARVAAQEPGQHGILPFVAFVVVWARLAWIGFSQRRSF